MITRSPIVLLVRIIAALALGAALVGCNRTAATPPVTTDGVAVTTTAPSDPQGPVQTAIAVRGAMLQYPAMGDSILTAFHLTANEFAALMKRIAADSTMSEEYRRGTA
jgi:hypothetical protein